MIEDQATLAEQIAGQVVAEVVRRKSEVADALDLTIVWEVCEIAAEKAVQILVKGTPSPMLLARSTPAVMAEVMKGRKIHAIKEFRAVSGLGLKDAKDIIDRLFTEEGITPS